MSLVRLGSRGMGAATVVLVALGCRKAAPDRAPADLVFRNGAVYTLDAARSWARTVAVREGRIVHVGGDSVPSGLIGPETEVVDLDAGC